LKPIPMTPSVLWCLALLPIISNGMRGDPEGYTDALRHINSTAGIPELEVLYTSSAMEAAAFLDKWSEQRTFGLYLQCGRDGRCRVGDGSIALVGICHGPRVLVFDLRPSFLRSPTTLPAPLAAFLENKDHTFFGMGLLDTAARLATDFRVVTNCMDYSVRAWHQMDLSGGLHSMAKRYLGVRPERLPALTGLSGQAAHAYLEWAVADHFTRRHGAHLPEWVVTMPELFRTHVLHPSGAAAYDWGAEQVERKQRQHRRAAARLHRRLAVANERAWGRRARLAKAGLSWRRSHSPRGAASRGAATISEAVGARALVGS